MGEGKKVVSPPGVENVRLMGHRPNIPLTCLSAPGGCTKNRYFICVPKIPFADAPSLRFARANVATASLTLTRSHSLLSRKTKAFIPPPPHRCGYCGSDEGNTSENINFPISPSSTGVNRLSEAIAPRT